MGKHDSEALDVIHYGPIGYERVRIPGGKFMMGSEKSEKDRFYDEGPVREVTVETFHMDRYPVTSAQYEQFLQAAPDAEEPKYWGGIAISIAPSSPWWHVRQAKR